MESKHLTKEERADISRRNGALSRGPVTDQGRRRVGRNGLPHTLLARTVVLDSESSDRFVSLLVQLSKEFQPRTTAEESLIETMAVSRWRHMRVWSLEKAGIVREIKNSAGAFAGEDPAIPVITARSNPVFNLLARDESRLDRQYDRALRTLLFQQKMRRQTQPKPAKSVS